MDDIQTCDACRRWWRTSEFSGCQCSELRAITAALERMARDADDLRRGPSAAARLAALEGGLAALEREVFELHKARNMDALAAAMAARFSEVK